MSKNIEVLSAVHGIAPRSDELLKLGGDVERGRASQESYDERVAQETADWLQLQVDASINLPENGKLDWQDHLRPIVKISKCFAPDIEDAPVTRWYDSNTFYRQPTITDKFNLDWDAARAWAETLGENVSLLAPQTFASLCEDEFGDLPADRNIFQLYSDLLFHFEQTGVKRVIFEDYHTVPNSLEPHGTLSDVKTYGEWCRDLDFSIVYPRRNVIEIPYVPKRNVHVEVGNSTLEHFGRQPDYARPNLEGAEIWQQVIDSQSTNIEALDVALWPIEALRLLKPARLVLTNSVDLERVPLPYAQDKVKVLGEFAIDLGEYFKSEGL